MFITGIDLSLTGTGVVVLKNDGIMDFLIKSKPTEKKRPIDEIERIVLIKNQIIDILKKYPPELVVIEGLAFGVRNATSLVQLAGLNYFIREYLWQNNIKFIIIPPTSLKKFITGHGLAKKDEMMMVVHEKYGVSFLDDNTNDAFCLAVAGRMFLEGNAFSEDEKNLMDKIKKQNE